MVSLVRAMDVSFDGSRRGARLALATARVAAGS
jgi:hypothetical protein